MTLSRKDKLNVRLEIWLNVHIFKLSPEALAWATRRSFTHPKYPNKEMENYVDLMVKKAVSEMQAKAGEGGGIGGKKR